MKTYNITYYTKTAHGVLERSFVLTCHPIVLGDIVAALTQMFGQYGGVTPTATTAGH